MKDTHKDYAPGSHPNLPPPVTSRGAIRWVRENLLSSPTNTVLTLLAIYLVYVVVPPLFNWAVLNSVVDAGSREECWSKTDGGACWAVVSVRFSQLMYGFYPEALRWRVDLTFILLSIAVVPILFDKVRFRRQWLMFSMVYPVIAYFLLWGGMGLEHVESAKFGGFMLTLVIGLTGIAVSLPIGILLALGRWSDLLALKVISTCFIEFIRGVPLITLLFVASTLLNYFLPPGTYFDLLLRVLIMVTLFSAAYIAEVIRGGLQAIPKGQFEAAMAMGLSYWKMMGLIVLPQAMKISIPGIVNTFIGLYKDTTLVVIIGLLDPLGLTQSILADSKWQGLSTELYVFIAAFFFVSC
ncbi:MAG: amino acid ABC transporter permease, partial [Kiloniellaceae bacterium]